MFSKSPHLLSGWRHASQKRVEKPSLALFFLGVHACSPAPTEALDTERRIAGGGAASSPGPRCARSMPAALHASPLPCSAASTAPLHLALHWITTSSTMQEAENCNNAGKQGRGGPVGRCATPPPPPLLRGPQALGGGAAAALLLGARMLVRLRSLDQPARAVAPAGRRGEAWNGTAVGQLRGRRAGTGGGGGGRPRRCRQRLLLSSPKT